MTQPETDRRTADPIGRITCFETGVEIGLLYQWDNGETQVVIYEDQAFKAPGPPILRQTD